MRSMSLPRLVPSFTASRSRPSSVLGCTVQPSLRRLR
jgi:hypothetical protein